MSRKSIGAALLVAYLGLTGQALAADMTVTLLGTGVPNPRPNRFSQSTLIEAGSQRLIFDFGRGVTIRLWQKKVPMGTINAGFLTHFHSDHLVGLPDLWLTGWLAPPYGQRKTPFVIYGPPGTKDMMTHLEKAFALDIKIRIEDEKNPPEGIAVQAHDIAPGVVYEKDGVKVSAFDVDHGDAIKPAYGYKIEYKGRSVVLSGDTRYSEEVIRQAKGADLLIHEVAAIKPELLERSPSFQRIFAHHVSPEQAGEVFTKSKPKLAVFSHIALYASPQIAAPNEDDILAGTRKTYAGPLVMGEDLMSFEIGDDVKMIPPSRN